MKTLLLAAAAVVCVASANIANACSPHGLIGQKWNQLQGALGNCIDDEADNGVGGRIEAFQFGWVNWDGHASQAFAVYGLIGQKWMALGGPKGFGQPTTDESDSATGRGRFNIFANGGSVLWLRGAPQAFAVFGAIRSTYGTERFEFGDLGFPVSDEMPLGQNGDRVSNFEHGSIDWFHDHGDTLVHIANSRYTYRIAFIAFGGGDPVGSPGATLSIFRDGTFGFSGSFHNAAAVVNPVTENTSIVVAIGSGNRSITFTFSDSGSVSAFNRDHPWNTNGNNAQIASTWLQLENGVWVRWNASTNADLGKLWSDMKAAAGAVGDVVAVVGAL
jgi:hypothetical protein